MTTILPTLFDIFLIFGAICLACFLVLMAWMSIEDYQEQDNISRSIDELEDLYAMPSVLSGGRERGRVERWRRS